MALPVRLIWNLRITFQEKLGLGVLFTFGIITMIFAIVRSVSLDATTASGQVSTEWLIFWGAIEGTVAILVGCLPAFAIFIKGRVKASRVQYGSYPTPNNSKRGTTDENRHNQRGETGSIQLQEIDVHRSEFFGSESKRNLVQAPGDGIIRVEHAWSQEVA